MKVGYLKEVLKQLNDEADVFVLKLDTSVVQSDDDKDCDVAHVTGHRFAFINNEGDDFPAQAPFANALYLKFKE